ncbi:vacuolar import and degradation protein-domain-containing protein [Pilobolus umbonatus]|nr:vacuolar import and degradation protein-domain-containing protein [Pilobolus umbonatus]
MPIIALNKPIIETKQECCEQQALFCKHSKITSQNIDQLMEISSPEPKKRTTLVSRTEDDYLIDISNTRLRNTSLASLYVGSRFKGVQKCGSSRYNVVVDIQHVNLKESKISGYLNIEGLTHQCPELTTFFEGEIIGLQYSFLTRKWQATQAIDSMHWGKFDSFEPYVSTFNKDGFVYDPYDNDFVYMRWKEQFLVPDHCVSNIDGASFAGFYYICYQRSTDTIQGFYYYTNNSDWFQELTLTHVNQHAFGNFEFR